MSCRHRYFCLYLRIQVSLVDLVCEKEANINEILIDFTFNFQSVFILSLANKIMIIILELALGLKKNFLCIKRHSAASVV